MTPLPARRAGLPRLAPVLLLVALALIVAACAPVGQAPGASGAPATPEPTPLVPASPGADPVSLLAWLFTPVFQALFILLAALYKLTGNIAVAIIVMTLIIRALVIPLFRQQTVSQRRMQLLQPEIREIQRRYRGDRQRISEAQMTLYKERGVNPAAGCLPLLLQFVLLIPMYSVIRDGLTNYDPSAMLSVFGVQLIDLGCAPEPVIQASGLVKPCIDTVVLGVDMSQPEILFPLPLIGGLSALALVAGLLQLVQSRMVMPPAVEGADQAAAVQRQTMLIFPLISVAYGAFLPAGLFIYWIVTTIFSIVQQYLIVGWGSFFPLFGWNPGFARNHTPRFPVAMPTLEPRDGSTAPPPRTSSLDRAASAAATVRPKERGGRQGRRGRRR